jgi:hypothetical protein
MNYIKHLEGFWGRLEGDRWMKACHISLYMALFQLWSLNRFAEKFPVSRAELMALSKTCSINTYAKCMTELDGWGYIRYFPSVNKHSGGEVICNRFDTGNNTTNRYKS